jgi:DNA-binding NarL/FixJ family response regulator
MAQIRILIADDHAVVRAGLRMLINAQPDMKIVAEVADSQEALRLIPGTGADVLILDLSMPGLPSIELIERLGRDCPQTRVLVLTMHDDPAYFRTVLAAGGFGYVVKTAADGELVTAIRAVHQGRTFFNVNHAGSLVANPPRRGTNGGPASPPIGALSPREREVLELVALGHTNQEIAKRLFLSVKTIETYRARLGTKLGLRSRAELVRYALEAGLLGTNTPAAEDHAL